MAMDYFNQVERKRDNEVSASCERKSKKRQEQIGAREKFLNIK